jgi:hypothetical protein
VLGGPAHRLSQELQDGVEGALAMRLLLLLLQAAPHPERDQCSLLVRTHSLHRSPRETNLDLRRRIRRVQRLPGTTALRPFGVCSRRGLWLVRRVWPRGASSMAGLGVCWIGLHACDIPPRCSCLESSPRALPLLRCGPSSWPSTSRRQPTSPGPSACRPR